MLDPTSVHHARDEDAHDQRRYPHQAAGSNPVDKPRHDDASEDGYGEVTLAVGTHPRHVTTLHRVAGQSGRG